MWLILDSGQSEFPDRNKMKPLWFFKNDQLSAPQLSTRRQPLQSAPQSSLLLQAGAMRRNSTHCCVSPHAHCKNDTASRVMSSVGLHHITACQLRRLSDSKSFCVGFTESKHDLLARGSFAPGRPKSQVRNSKPPARPQGCEGNLKPATSTKVKRLNLHRDGYTCMRLPNKRVCVRRTRRSNHQAFTVLCFLSLRRERRVNVVVLFSLY